MRYEPAFNWLIQSSNIHSINLFLLLREQQTDVQVRVVACSRMSPSCINVSPAAVRKGQWPGGPTDIVQQWCHHFPSEGWRGWEVGGRRAGKHTDQQNWVTKSQSASPWPAGMCPKSKPLQLTQLHVIIFDNTNKRNNESRRFGYI